MGETSEARDRRSATGYTEFIDPMRHGITIRPTDNPTAIDLAHAVLLAGVVASAKPDDVLELGFGGGYSTDAIVQSLTWNGRGRLTIVDDWSDWRGVRPTHAARFPAVEFVTESEESFVKSAPANRYDMLVSDADHSRSHLWFGDHCRIVRDSGTMFFHDTANADYPNLAGIVRDVESAGMPHTHFIASSRPGERCGRGWLMATNRKPRIALVSAWDSGSAGIGEYTRANREAYCRRHGYAFRLTKFGGGGPWVKLPALSAAFDEGFAWTVWMDADVWVTNPEIRLESFVGGGSDLVAGHDANGINNGVMFWRNTPWSREMIRAWADDGRRFDGHPNPEQTALACLLYRQPREKWEAVPQKRFNAYLYGEYPELDCPDEEWTPGDFALHLPGMPDERRREIFARFAG